LGATITEGFAGIEFNVGKDGLWVGKKKTKG